MRVSREGDFGKLDAFTRDGKIAPGEDWFALKDANGRIQAIGHIDNVVEAYGEGMQVAFLGRGFGCGFKLDWQGVIFTCKNHEQLHELRNQREAAYKRDITRYGTLSLDCISVYTLTWDYPTLVMDETTAEWVKIDPGVCLACHKGKGCWLHKNASLP